MHSRGRDTFTKGKQMAALRHQRLCHQIPKNTTEQPPSTLARPHHHHHQPDTSLPTGKYSSYNSQQNSKDGDSKERCQSISATRTDNIRSKVFTRSLRLVD